MVHKSASEKTRAMELGKGSSRSSMLHSSCVSQPLRRRQSFSSIMLMLHAFFRRQQEEGKPRGAQDDLDETALGGIPSLDFRPVLDLFAPTGNKFQMSPCRECGGTLEVGCGVNIEQISEENLQTTNILLQHMGPTTQLLAISVTCQRVAQVYSMCNKLEILWPPFRTAATSADCPL